MKNEKEFTLIDGEFSPAEARKILMSVFLSKLQFHQLNNFSAQERLGKSDEIAEKRIPQLKKSMDEIVRLLTEAEARGEQLEIRSEVVISLVTAETTA